MILEKGEKGIKELFIGKCWQYLHDNFHKFTPTNQIKVALEITKKSMPTQLEHGGELKITKMDNITLTNNRVMEYDIGN